MDVSCRMLLKVEMPTLHQLHLLFGLFPVAHVLATVALGPGKPHSAALASLPSLSWRLTVRMDLHFPPGP